MIMKLCDDLVKLRIRAQSCKELALQIITLTIVASIVHSGKIEKFRDVRAEIKN